MDSFYNKVIVSSAPRTGSMVVWNICRQLLTDAGREVIAEDCDGDAERLKKKHPPHTVHCVKTHCSVTSSDQRTIIINTLRDVSEAVFSHMQFQKVDFDAIFQMHVQWYKSIINNIDQRWVVPFTMIDNDLPAVVNFLDRILMTNLPAQTLIAIANKFSKDKVSQKILSLTDEITVRSNDGSLRQYDPQTGFQSGHISNSRDYRQGLTDEQLQKIENALKSKT